MHQSIHRLVYLSRNRIEGDQSARRREIDAILSASRRNNPKAGITGALMFNAGCFAQVLEGAHDNIQATFERIQCDMRHAEVVILAIDQVAERQFSRWSMAYVGQETRASKQFSDSAQDSGFDSAELDGEHIFRLIQEHLAEAEQVSS